MRIELRKLKNQGKESHGMISSNDKSIDELLSNEYILFVPNYQRYYVWGKKDISDFLEDAFHTYEQNCEGIKYQHFFGQIILRKKGDLPGDRSKMEIVDGQQRLTTFSILVAVVCDYLQQVKEQNPISFLDIEAAILKLNTSYLVSKTQYSEAINRVSLSNNDEPTFRAILSNNSIQINDMKKNSPTESVKNLCAAYTQMENGFYAWIEKTPNKDHLIEIASKFIETVAASFRIVLLKTETPGYDFALYQIVNDRGVSLTAAELLKARTLQLLSINQDALIQGERLWDDILADPGQSTQRYLIWYYISRLHNTISANDIHNSYELNIFHTKKKHLLNNAEQSKLLNELQQLYHAVTICRSLECGVFPQASCNPIILSLFNILVRNLKNDACIPIYINILNNNSEKNIIQMFHEITFLLIKFFFVSKSICNIHANSISQCYKEIGKSIVEGQYSFEKTKQTLINKMNEKHCIEQFSTNLDGNIYTQYSSAIVKFILYMLETFYIADDFSLKSLLKSIDDSINVNFSLLSTEHIYGQRMEGSDVDKAMEAEKNKLGNLTLLGSQKNSEEGNKPYTQKRELYGKSLYCLTKEVSTHSEWTIAEFKERHQTLVARLIQIFQM